jgi:hypothetical protein
VTLYEGPTELRQTSAPMQESQRSQELD